MYLEIEIEDPKPSGKDGVFMLDSGISALFFSLLLTLIIHPLPIWIYRYIIREKPVAPQTAKKIVIIDAVIVFIIMFFLAAKAGGSPISFFALFLWSKVCYSSLTKGYNENNLQNQRRIKKYDYDTLLPSISDKVIKKMNDLGIISQQKLECIQDDRGLLNGIFYDHTSSKYSELRNSSEDTFLIHCGADAFGAGVWTIYKTKCSKTEIDQMNMEDVVSIAKEFRQSNAYLLGLNALGISLDSASKKDIDEIIISGKNALLKKTGEATDNSGLKVYMQVLFNAGLTVAMNNDFSGAEFCTAKDSTSIDCRSTAPVRFCRKCGTKLREDSRFCGNCGTRIEVVDQ